MTAESVAHAFMQATHKRHLVQGKQAAKPLPRCQDPKIQEIIHQLSYTNAAFMDFPQKHSRFGYKSDHE
jgi:hypothetical protein